MTDTLASSGSSDGGFDPAAASGYNDAPERVGFFTDTSVCIGCKACEVACKEWNEVPAGKLSLSGHSYDNTLGLDADSWRHVAFIEQRKPIGETVTGTAHVDVPAAGTPRVEMVGDQVPTSLPMVDGAGVPTDLRWLMSSDVCKHCTHAACLDVCPTGSLFRTEYGTVVVQQDICNGCGYCIPACPYGVIDQREGDGRAFKCTLCYDRLEADLEPACAKACPTDSIQFGPLAEMRERAGARVKVLQDNGIADARLYGEDPDDGVGGHGSIFLLLDEPEVYGLPPDPVVTTRDPSTMWKHVGLAAGAVLAGVAASFLERRS